MRSVGSFCFLLLCLLSPATLAVPSLEMSTMSILNETTEMNEEYSPEPIAESLDNGVSSNNASAMSNESGTEMLDGISGTGESESWVGGPEEKSPSQAWGFEPEGVHTERIHPEDEKENTFFNDLTHFGDKLDGVKIPEDAGLENNVEKMTGTVSGASKATYCFPGVLGTAHAMFTLVWSAGAKY